MSILWMRKKQKGGDRGSKPTLTLGKEGMYLSTAATLKLGNPDAVLIGLVTPDLDQMPGPARIALVSVKKDKSDPTAWSLGYAKGRRGGAVLGSPWLNKKLKIELGLTVDDAHKLEVSYLQENTLFFSI